MELRHIRYFVAVAEAGTFHRAAERLAMAQPPLTQQIHALERELGVDLFDRSRRQIQLTAAGRVFLADAYQILERADEAVLRAQGAGRGELGHLVIGYTSLVHCPLFAPIIQRYRQAYPDVQIILRDLVTLEQAEQLSANTLDLSFATHASEALSSADQDRLSYEIIFSEELVAIVPPDHRLAGSPSVPLWELRDESWLWFARRFDPATYDYMMRLFGRTGFRPRITQEVNQGLLIFSLVAAGLGISLVPRSALHFYNINANGDNMVLVAVTDPTPTVEFDLVWRTDDPSLLVQAFLATAREVSALAYPPR